MTTTATMKTNDDDDGDDDGDDGDECHCEAHFIQCVQLVSGATSPNCRLSGGTAFTIAFPHLHWSGPGADGIRAGDPGRGPFPIEISPLLSAR